MQLELVKTVLLAGELKSSCKKKQLTPQQMELRLSEDIMAEGKTKLQLPLWLPVNFSLPVASLLQTPSKLQPHTWHRHTPFPRQLF